MFKIVHKADIAESIKEYEVEAPHIAQKAKPGNFVLVRGDEKGERIPLTIADSDPVKGTITLVMQEIGRGTMKLGVLPKGGAFLDVVGPLGKDREIHPGNNRTVCCVSGGLGVAPMYPQTKACHLAGNRVISIIGARNKSLLFWQDRIEAASDATYYSTDDGSFGHHGYATQILERLITEGERLDEVIAIGPVPHMRAVANVCKKYNIPIVVSLNPIMVDGTGMCGGCRVSVGGETKYACVDGPEFDGALVDFDELMSRQGTYKGLEQEARERNGKHTCNLERQAREIENQQQPEIPFPDAYKHFEHEALTDIVKAFESIADGTGRFEEVAFGLSPGQARIEADRCRLCLDPKCISGCPVEVDIPDFIRAIQQDNMPLAARILKRKNSLPAICGRVCPQETQCESKCVLGKFEKPVAIGALERYVADWEARYGGEMPEIASEKTQRVAVVGSGPGGLTCAGDLAKLGYQVTIFEAFHDTGGVLRYGIPEFRLPKSIVDREVEYVKKLGVDIKLNMVIGKTFTVEDLMADGYEAVFIAVGAGAPAFLGIEGESLIGVYSANEFLTRVNLMKAFNKEYDTPVHVGERIAVIGAGNVAMDAARTAKRLGAKVVTIVYRRTEAEMPARLAEVTHAKQEGILFQLLTAPVRILGDEKDRVRGIECIRMRLGEPDSSGRCRPEPVPGSEFDLKCDMVIPALGNTANPLLTSNTQGLDLNRRGNIVAHPETGETSLPGVFAGGDIVIGAATVIEAMGAGKRAARAIDAYLSGVTVPN